MSMQEQQTVMLEQEQQYALLSKYAFDRWFIHLEAIDVCMLVAEHVDLSMHQIYLKQHGLDVDSQFRE